MQTPHQQNHHAKLVEHTSSFFLMMKMAKSFFQAVLGLKNENHQKSLHKYGLVWHQ
jgi:hypothetical protein